MSEEYIKVKSNLNKNFTISLPENIKVGHGPNGPEVVTIPKRLLENRGVQGYIKSKRLSIVEDEVILPEAPQKIEAPKVVEKIEITDEVIVEGPDAVLVGAINEDGSFIPKEELDLPSEDSSPKKRSKKSSAPKE